MSQARNHLQAVSPTGTSHQHATVTNQLVKQYNRQDTDTFAPIYAADTGSATAYAIAPVPGIKFYVIGQIFAFKAANTNSGTTPTLNVNGMGAGTITKQGGAVAIGDIVANSFYEVQVTSLTPTFQLLSPVASPITITGATTFLAADLALNNVANFFSGPNTGSIGAAGWVVEITAKANMLDAAGIATLVAQIFDGTNPQDGASGTTAQANFDVTLPLGVILTLSAATTFTLRAKDLSSVNGVLRTTGFDGAAHKASSITWKRLA